jgi:hypothetical protein
LKLRLQAVSKPIVVLQTVVCSIRIVIIITTNKEKEESLPCQESSLLIRLFVPL